MSFKQEMIRLEKKKGQAYTLKIGALPVILTAPHTMQQQRLDGSIKVREPFTEAIAKYVSKNTNCSYLIKEKNTLLDSNGDKMDPFKDLLEKTIKENNIKLLIDIHGASNKRDFDVEFGTLNNLSADFSTIKELEEALIENKVYNINHNEPFKGGGITKYIYGTTNIDIIQIEINGNYRDVEKIENLENICKALIKFVRQYSKYQKKMNYSFALGIDEKIYKLEKEGFIIEEKEEGYQVTFPKEKEKLWENFVEYNLKKGFWNEYLKDDKVIFLFQLEEGIKRIEVKNYQDDEVLKLCETLTNKNFKSLKEMLKEQKFYEAKIKE